MVEKNIGEILKELGLISSEQYETFQAASKKLGQDFETYVIAHNLVRDKDLAQARAVKFGLPLIEVITDKMAEPDVLGKIPLKFLRENSIIPLRSPTGTIIIAMADPLNYQPADELDSLFGGSTSRAVAARSTIIDAINRYYPLEGTKQMIAELEEEKGLGPEMDFGTIQEEDILGMASEAPIIKLVNHILYQAVKRDASDIHIEPFEKRAPSTISH